MNENTTKSWHLGDGAYMSLTTDGIVLTANHHDPAKATDAVYLDSYAITELERLLEMMETK